MSVFLLELDFNNIMFHFHKYKVVMRMTDMFSLGVHRWCKYGMLHVCSLLFHQGYKSLMMLGVTPQDLPRMYNGKIIISNITFC